MPNGRQRALTNLLETERTLFTGQLGLATRAQVLGRGITDAQIRNAITQGRWLRTAPGLYALGTWPPAPGRRLLAACLMTGGVASHASAAWLWGLLANEPTYVSVSLPRGQRANVPTPRGRWQGSHGAPDLSTLVIHQSSDLFPSCISSRHGVPTTNPIRSLVDLAAVASPESLDEALDVALATRLVTAEGLLAEASRLRRPGRQGPTELRRRLKGRRFAGALAPSVLESRALRLLAAGNVKVDRCEAVVDEGRYRLDIQVGPQLFVEVDGFAYHWGPEKKHHDDLRRNKLRLLGYEVLVYDWEAIVNEQSRVLNEVRTALGKGLRRPPATGHEPPRRKQR